MPRITLRTLARVFLGGLTAASAMLPAERASASYLLIPPASTAAASVRTLAAALRGVAEVREDNWYPEP